MREVGAGLERNEGRIKEIEINRMAPGNGAENRMRQRKQCDHKWRSQNLIDQNLVRFLGDGLLPPVSFCTSTTLSLLLLFIQRYSTFLFQLCIFHNR